MSWDDSCWTDDALSIKKLYPKFQFPSKSKKWTPRVRTTDESMMLCVDRAQNCHSRSPHYLRRKLTASALEGMSESAAAVWHIGKELQASVAIPDEVLQREWYEPWARGSDHIDVEVQAALLDKSDSFSVTQHIPTLKKLVDSHVLAAPVQAPPAQAETIEVDNFNLVMKKLKYDVTVFETWERKCANVHAAHEHAAHGHRASERAKCMASAELFMHSYTKLLAWEGSQQQQIIAEIMNFRRDQVALKLGADVGNIPSVVVLNWASPCLIPAANQSSQMGVLTWALHDNMQSLGVAVSPAFTYSKGKLHLEESKMIQQLSMGNHNLDVQFSILFKSQCDTRDQRPMVYPSRLVFPSPIGDPSKSIWFGCELRRARRTEDVAQLPVKQMKEAEDLAADALPPSTDAREGHIHGAAKYCQLGAAAWEAVVSGVIAGSSLTDIPAVIIIDLFVRVGDLLEAFCSQRAIHTTPSLFYVGVCENQLELDWVHKIVQESLADKYEQGALAMPSGAKCEKEVPADLLDPLPARPQMNLLIISPEHKLQMPAAIVKEWQLHPKFGTEFVTWLDQFVQKYVIMDPSDPTPEPGKRPAGGEPSSGPSAKIPKTTTTSQFTEHIVEIKDISEALLAESRIGKDGPFCQIRAQHQVYLVNKSQQEWNSKGAIYVCGFGKGSFKLLKSDATEGITFRLHSSEDKVIFNGAVSPLSKIIAEQRQKKPDCQICYHKLAVDDTDPKKFALEQTHKVVFCPKEESGEVNINSLAAKEALHSWNSSQCLEILWVVRWTAKGLMPVKPAVYLKGSVVLAVGRALKCM